MCSWVGIAFNLSILLKRLEHLENLINKFGEWVKLMGILVCDKIDIDWIREREIRGACEDEWGPAISAGNRWCLGSVCGFVGVHCDLQQGAH